MLRKILASTTLVSLLSVSVVAEGPQQQYLSTVATAAAQEAAFDLYTQSYTVNLPLKVPFKFWGITLGKVDVTLTGEIGEGNIDLDIYYKKKHVGTAEGTFDRVEGLDVNVKVRNKRPIAISGSFDGQEAAITSWYTQGKPKESTYTAEILKTNRVPDGLNVTFTYAGSDGDSHERTAFVTPLLQR